MATAHFTFLPLALLCSAKSTPYAGSRPRASRPRATPTSLGTECRATRKELRLPYNLQEGQTRLFHRLPSGLSMEAIVQKGEECNGVSGGSTENCPLVFVHGSFHAAWCWAEHWLPFFSRAGHDCYAISLLGQGESDVPEGKVAGTLQTHTSDIAHFIREEVKVPPVLVGHSFGGLMVQSYISSIGAASAPSNSARHDPPLMLSGAVLVCSVPPSGNGGLILRYMLSKPVAAVKVTLSLAAKAFASSLPLCKETFFSSSMDDRLVQRYQELMKGSCQVPLFDLRKLNASLPVPPVPKDFVDILVLGAENDFIVDAEGLQQTAEFYDVKPICLEGIAHDVMLDSAWEKGAETILSWLKSFSRRTVY